MAINKYVFSNCYEMSEMREEAELRGGTPNIEYQYLQNTDDSKTCPAFHMYIN